MSVVRAILAAVLLTLCAALYVVIGVTCYYEGRREAQADLDAARKRCAECERDRDKRIKEWLFHRESGSAWRAGVSD